MNDVKEAEDILYSHGLCPDVFEFHGLVAVEISWGDWKHDHLACTQLLARHNFVQVSEILTEQDGSDCYSAIHYYYKRGL